MEIVLPRLTNKSVNNLRGQCFSNMHFILFQKALWHSGDQSENYYDKVKFFLAD